MINIDYLYNPDIARKSFEKNYFLDKELGFRVIENGTILPHKSVVIPGKWHFGLGGIVDSTGAYIADSSLHHGTGGAYTPPPQDIIHNSETVIYLGLFYRIWGHDLTDNIRRVWFLKSDFFKSEFKHCPIVYVPYKDGYYTIDRQPDFKRLLEILEVDVDNLQPITQPTQYDKIILPDNSFTSPHNPDTGFTAEYREAVDRVRDFALKNRTPTSIKKLYFYHGGRGTVGEERMAEYFKSKGYEIITGEQRENNLDEELNLLINAESFTSAIGSCSHNCLFLRDNAEFILIPRAASQLSYYQEILNQVHPLNINYIDSSLSVFARTIMGGAYFFIVSEQLKRFFGDKFDGYEEEDFKNFLQYVKSCTGVGRTLIPAAKAYYSKILPDFMEQLKRRKDLITAYNMPPDWETFRPPMLAGLSYQTHVHNRGWRDGWHSENQFSNPLEQKLDVLAISVNFPNHKIYYSVYFNDKEGWSKEVQAPEMAGTVGVRKPIYGMRIRFDEAGTKEFDILYRMHKFDGTWTDWAKNGETLYSYGVKLNAIQIKLEPKT